MLLAKVPGGLVPTEMFSTAFGHLRWKNPPEKHEIFFLKKIVVVLMDFAAVLNRRKKKARIFFKQRHLRKF
jgi:hypothetical protein